MLSPAKDFRKCPALVSRASFSHDEARFGVSSRSKRRSPARATSLGSSPSRIFRSSMFPKIFSVPEIVNTRSFIEVVTVCGYARRKVCRNVLRNSIRTPYRTRKRANTMSDTAIENIPPESLLWTAEFGLRSGASVRFTLSSIKKASLEDRLENWDYYHADKPHTPFFWFKSQHYSVRVNLRQLTYATLTFNAIPLDQADSYEFDNLAWPTSAVCFGPPPGTLMLRVFGSAGA